MREKYVKYFLIFVIFIGVVFRLLSLNNYLFEDEALQIVSGMKFFHQSYADGLNYVSEHPPIARFLIGLPSIFIKSDYSSLKSATPGFYWFTYSNHTPLKDNFLQARFFTIIIGILTICFTYLIAKKLFGRIAALWSAALVSISADFIFYSSHTFLEIYMLFFSLAAIYFYLKFLDAKNKQEKYIFGFLLFFFLFMELGSRAFNALFLAASLPIANFISNRKINKEFLVIAAISAIAVILIYTSIWPPDLQKKIFELKGSATSIFGISFAQEIAGIFLRNSYIFLFSILLLIPAVYDFCKNKKFNSLFNRKFSIITTFFILSFFSLGITNLSSSETAYMRYISLLFIPLSIAGGYALAKYSQSRIILSLSIIIIAVTIINISQLLPNHIQDYSNFGISQYRLFPSDEINKAEEELKYLNENNNPAALTNEPNILIFYIKNQTKAEERALSLGCTNAVLKEVLEKNFTIIHRFVDTSIKKISDDPNMCTYLNAIHVKSIENVGDSGIFIIDDSDIISESSMKRMEEINKKLDEFSTQPIITNNNILISIQAGRNVVLLVRENDLACLQNPGGYLAALMEVKPILVFDKKFNESIDEICQIKNLNTTKLDSFDDVEMYEVN